jgi:hypothetical protein
MLRPKIRRVLDNILLNKQPVRYWASDRRLPAFSMLTVIVVSA